VSEQNGQTTQASMSRERGGRVTAKLVFDVPLASAPALVERFKLAGIVRVQQASRNHRYRPASWPSPGWT